MKRINRIYPKHLIIKTLSTTLSEILTGLNFICQILFNESSEDIEKSDILPLIYLKNGAVSRE